MASAACTLRSSIALALYAGAMTSSAWGQSTDSPSAETAPAAEARTLKKISVVEDAEEGYAVPTSTAGSKTELPLRDIPQAITVFDESLIRDLSPHVLDEIADYVAGVEREAVQANPYAISFFFRGFNTAGGASAYNGFREQGFQTPQSAINIERIEFLKGPASVLYGASNALSGLVNIVSKQPLAESQHRLEASVGSFEHRAITADSTAPINEDGTLRYRVTAAYDEGGNFVDGVDQESRFVSPVLSWDVTPTTRVDLELVLQDIDRPGRIGYRPRHPSSFQVPVELNFGDTSAPGGELYRHLGRLELRHELPNGWTLRQGLFAQNVRSDDETVQPLGFQADGRTLNRRIRNVDEYQRERYSQTELTGESVTGALQHQWLAGIEIGKSWDGYGFIVAPYSPLDVFDPQYPGEQLGPLTVPFAPTESGTKTRAVYLQDLVSFGGGFKMMLGARYDEMESWTLAIDRSSPREDQDDSEISPRVGLIYQPSDTTSLYASWSRSFQPNIGRTADGALLTPQEGVQYEVGVKQDLLSGLSITTSVFEYRRQNVLTADPSDPDLNIAVGEQRSRGVELEAIGRLTDDWSLFASYAFLDAEVTKDNTLPVGDRRTGVPRHSAGLFSKFNLHALGLTNWSVTGGISYASERESGLPNDPSGPFTSADVRLPAFTKVDLGVLYDAGRYSMRLHGRNLTDEEIYDGYNSTFEARAPRSLEFSFTVHL